MVQRIRWLFSWRKLPGLALSALGLVWRLADYFGRLDVLARVAESVGGTPALVAAIVLSVWFSVALVVFGMAYVVFIGEPKKGAQIHPAWPYVGWSIFAISTAAVLSVTIYGFYELQLRKAYAAGASGIPRNSSPANPKSAGNQRPIYADVNRTLTPDQQRVLITEGGRLHDELSNIPIMYLETDMEAFAYASQLNTTFSRAAIHSGGVSPQPLGEPGREGVMIEVPNKNAPSASAIKLQQLLLIADIDASFVTSLPQFGDTQAILFVGPRPLQR